MRRQRLLAAFGIFLALTLVCVGGWIWYERLTLQRRLIHAAIARVQPHLPFKIESVDWDASWSDFRNGRIPRLKLELTQLPLRLRLEGPLTFRLTPGSLFEVSYRPRIVVTPDASSARLHPAPFQLALNATVARDLDRATRWEVRIQEKAWNWPARGLTLRAPELHLLWEKNLLQAKASLAELSYDDPARPGTRLVQVQSLAWESLAPLTLTPFAWGEKIEGRLNAKSGEVLWDDVYFDLPLDALPLELSAFPKALRLEARLPSLRITGTADTPEAIRTRWAWTLSPVSLPEIARRLTSWTWFSRLAGIEFHSGRWSARGSATIERRKAHPPRIRDLTGLTEVKDAALRVPDAKLAARGLSLRLPFAWTDPNDGGASLSSRPLLRIDDLWFRRLHGQLEPTQGSLERGKFRTDHDLPLRWDQLELSVGPIAAELLPKGYRLQTRATIRPTPLRPLLAAACLKARLPAAELSAEFPSIRLTPASFVPQGELTVASLGGRLRVREFATHDWATAVPELHFDAEWSGFRLDRLGKFLGFGKMDGTLVGKARDVVMQGWLPTQYDFTLEAKPLRHKDIVFSPEAMRNFVKLVTGQDIAAQLPGMLRWIYFGWPRRVTGGYDVLYAGISLFSRDGSIVLETLDPKERLTKEKERFILYGGRDFRMPLKSSRYPVILDAPAVANYVARMNEFFAELARNQKENDHEESSQIPDESGPCEPPTF